LPHFALTMFDEEGCNANSLLNKSGPPRGGHDRLGSVTTALKAEASAQVGRLVPGLSVLVVNSNETLMDMSFGLANRASGVEAASSILCNWFSMTKVVSGERPSDLWLIECIADRLPNRDAGRDPTAKS
jgi:hypothetical protein